MRFRLIFTAIVIQLISIHGAQSQIDSECETTSPFYDLNSILVVGKNYAPNHCWNSRKNLNNRPNLKSDLNICQCLQKSSHPSFKYLSIAQSNAPDQRLTEEGLKEDAKETGVQFGLEQDALALEAFIWSKGDRDFTQRVLSNTPDLNTQTKPSSPINAGLCVGNVCRMNFGNFDKMSDKQQGKVEKVSEIMLNRAVASFKVEQNKSPEILSEKIVYPGKQCVTAKDYFLWRQLPQGKKINDLISSSSINNFSSKDWNYMELEEEYEELMKLSIQERSFRRQRIVELKEKLKFLNSNQMLKTFLAANSDLSDLDKNDSISSDRKANIRSVWEKVAPEIEEKKKNLFKVMKNFSEAQRNVSKMNDPKTIETYQNELKKFFTDDNLNLLMNENERQGHYRVTSSFKNRLASPPLTYKTITDSFIKDSPAGDPADCKGYNLNEERCTEIYSKYCQKFIGIEKEIINREEDSEIADDLHETLKNDFNPDLNNNPEFKRWNDQICNTKFSKSSVATSPPLTFFEYLKKNCRGCEKDTEKVSQMRERFLKEYTWPHTLKGNVDRDQIQVFKSITSSKAIPKIKEPITRDSSMRVKDNVSFTQSLNSKMKPNVFSVAPESNKQQTAEGSQTSFSSASGAIDQGNFTNSRNFSPGYVSQIHPEKSDPKKIEEMSNEERSKYLSKLEKEYQQKVRDLEKKFSKNGAAESGSSSKEIAALRSEIDTWKALLSQQQNITAQQMKMLNDSMNARARQESVTAGAATKASKKRPESNKEASLFSAPQKTNPLSRDGNEDVTRSSQVAKEASSSGGSSQKPVVTPKASSTSSTTSSASAAASTSDSVAREQAKLNGLDKSFLLESVKGPSPEAFSLPVSSELYQNLKTDPSRLTLDSKQIELLNSRGMITIIVATEGRPPLELKVEKVESKILYKVKDQEEPKRAPASRVFTREALELQFQNQR